MFKKFTSVALVAAMTMTMFAATPVKKVQAAVTILTGKTITLDVGDSDLIAVKQKGAKFKTSNKKIATVSKKGEVKGKKAGSCKITVSVGKSKKKVTVKVLPATAKMSAVSVVGSNSAESAAKLATIKATWKKVKGASGYYVYYSKSKSGKYSKVTVKGGKKTSTTIGKLTFGNTYYVKVKAYAKAGKKKLASSEYSKIKSVKTYMMKWNDEFNGTKLDDKKWNTKGAVGKYGFGNEELQDYEPEYSEVKNGSLIIKPQFDWDPNTKTFLDEKYTENDVPHSKNIFSTKVWTKGQYSVQYGKVEFRAKLPKGMGTWAACWMLGDKNGWPLCGEIDVLETTKQLEKTSIPQTIHCNKFNGMPTSSGPKYKATSVATATSAYHNYGIEWNAKTISFFIDGKKTWTYDPSKYVLSGDGTDNPNIWPYNQKFYLIINCAIGGTLGGNPDPRYWTKIGTKEGGIETYQDKMYVDYVRVYQ